MGQCLIIISKIYLFKHYLLLLQMTFFVLTFFILGTIDILCRLNASETYKAMRNGT